MEKHKSIEFLNKCLNEIKSLSQEEFDKIVIENGLDIETNEIFSTDMNFEILFNNPTQINEEYEGSNFADPVKYKSIINVLYSKEKADKKEYNLPAGNISRKTKKYILLKILSNNSVLNNEFLARLKKCIPLGLASDNICTDSEYEALKKEFNI